MTVWSDAEGVSTAPMRLYLYLLLAAAYSVTLLARAARREWMPIPSDAEYLLEWTPLALLALLAMLSWAARNLPMNWRLFALAMLLAGAAILMGLIPACQ